MYELQQYAAALATVDALRPQPEPVEQPEEQSEQVETEGGDAD